MAQSKGNKSLPYFDGGIAEFLLYNRSFDDSMLVKLREQLKGYYFP